MFLYTDRKFTNQSEDYTADEYIKKMLSGNCMECDKPAELTILTNSNLDITILSDCVECKSLYSLSVSITDAMVIKSNRYE